MQMDKEYEAFLSKFIPSKDTRAKIIEVGHQFSDWDRAAIIWNSDIPLAGSTEDTGDMRSLSKRQLRKML